jgi:hypothetical protein
MEDHLQSTGILKKKGSSDINHDNPLYFRNKMFPVLFLILENVPD